MRPVKRKAYFYFMNADFALKGRKMHIFGSYKIVITFIYSITTEFVPYVITNDNPNSVDQNI